MIYSLRDVVNGLLTDLQQVIKDSKISPVSVAYWVTMLGDRLKSQHIVKRDTQQFLTIFPDITVQTATDNSVKNAVKGRKYITIPASFYSLDFDKGIDFVSYYNDDPDCRPEFTYMQMTRTRAQEVYQLYENRHEKPSLKNPYWYIAGNIMAFPGIENTPVNRIEMGIYTTFDPVNTVDIDAPFEFPQELMPILQKQVIDLGRFVMMIPKERVSDGDNEVVGVPTQKLVSVNDDQNV